MHGGTRCVEFLGADRHRVRALWTPVQHTAVHQQVQELGEEERVAVHPPEQCGAGVLAQFGAAEVVAQQSRRGGLRQRRQGE